MPYIDQNQRPELDRLIAPFIHHLKSLPVEEQDGALNYSVTKIIKHVYPLKYFHINRALGVLTGIMQEYYRKLVTPYEEKKISENGDVE
ncbi:MAG TPA: hypothetical protein VLF20_00495 [Patescibacteria group bacterium]|nr:hypothetical protein [Patescibacteria group bacterium]